MQTVENPRDFTEGGGGNPLILLSPEDQDPLASLLPWLQPLFSHFLLANRACLFLYLHEHFSYLLGNTCWVEENAGLTLSCFTNLTSIVPQRQPALWSIPVCALGPKMNKLHLTFCSFQTNFPPGHAWAGELTLAGIFSARPSPQFKALLGDAVLGTLKSCSGDPADKNLLESTSTHIFFQMCTNCMARL